MTVVRRGFTAYMAITLMATLFLFPAPTADAACYSNTSAEKSFARKMNQARSAAGKPALRLDPQLSKAAIVHTKEMINRNTLYHTPDSTLRRRVTNWVTLGENVGYGSSVTSLHAAFMDSPAHRANILYSEFRYVGVGVKTANGRMWVTVIFEARNDPGSPLC